MSLLLAPATKNLVISTSLLETALGSWCRVEGEARKLVTVSIAFTAALVIGSLGGVGKGPFTNDVATLNNQW